MNRNKHLPLTETTFYILLALRKPSHGYVIMQTVEELSDGQVKVAAGTLYGAIENLLKHNLIHEVGSEDKRRRVYALTPQGNEVLSLETQRLKHMAAIAESRLTGGKGQ